MPTFLFRFGFCTPAQWRGNEEHGWDDESSAAFLVEADDRAEAEAWGHEVADAFVTHEFAKAGMLGVANWKEDAFAAWIEDDMTAYPEPMRQRLPVVQAGCMPDFDRWTP